MKQVWILNHYAQEPGGAGGTRHYHLAEHIEQFGWQATIIAASVELNSGRQRLTRAEKHRLETIEKVSFLWVSTPEYEGNGGGRMLNMLAYSWRVLKPQLTGTLPRPDVVVGSSVHPFAALAGALLAWRFNVPFVFEVRDLWPQTLVDMGRLRDRSLVTWLMRKLELWLYRRANQIVVLLPKAADYIVPLGIDAKKIVWIPNGVDLSLYPTGVPQRVAQTDKFCVMYLGAHGQANGLEVVLRAMQIVQKEAGDRIELRLIGDGPEKAALKALAVQLSLKNIHFEKPVAKRDVPALAAQADAFVIAVCDLPQLYRYGISMNKLFDYLAAAKPILIASNAPNNPVSDANAGIAVPADDAVSLAKAILTLSSLPASERAAMGQRGRKYVEREFDFRSLAKKFAATLDHTLEAATRSKP
jgi:glycosyltransferase involved in cell wall biosynthesis